MLFLTDLLFSPINGFKFVMRTLIKVAEEQYTDDAPLKEQLLELQVRLENGELSDQQYVEEEAAILAELREIQNRKRELAGEEREASHQPFIGVVGEGSGASLTYTPQGESSLPQLEIDAPQFTFGEGTADAVAEEDARAPRATAANEIFGVEMGVETTPLKKPARSARRAAKKKAARKSPRPR